MLSPVNHVDPFEVNQGFADLQAEQHQSHIRQRVLVLSQVVSELQRRQSLS